MEQQKNTGNNDTLGGRLKLLDPQTLTEEQQQLYHYLMDSKVSWAKRSHFQGATEDGKLIGPFNAFLYSPQLGRAFNNYTDTEAANTSLSSRVREIVILTVGSFWQAAYELYAHKAVAHTVGLDEAAIEAISNGQEPEHLTDQELTAYTFTHTLVSKHAIDNDLYAKAVRVFGEKGVADIIHLAGMYTTVSALLNTFEVPEP